MKGILKTTILTLAILAGITESYGQKNCGIWDLNLLVGANLGATTPVPLPNALHVTKYNPLFNPKVGADITFFLMTTGGSEPDCV